MPCSLRRLLPALLLLTIPAAPSSAQEKPAAAPQPVQPAAVVSQIDFAGRNNVPEAVMRGALTLAPGQPFSARQLQADRAALMKLGYFRSVGAAQKTNGGNTEVVFNVVEWPRVLHIRILGNTVVELRALQAVITTQRGQVLCAPQLQNDIRAIERLYRENGYVARVSEKLLDQAATSGILRFEILEVRIDDVQVDGPPELAKKARDTLQEAPPDLYRPDAVARERDRLLAIKGIKSAVPRVETTGPGKVRIRWLLNQPPPEGK